MRWFVNVVRAVARTTLQTCRHECGASVVEYALFLGLVVGAAWIGAEFLGFAVRDSFKHASSGLAGSGNAKGGVSSATGDEVGGLEFAAELTSEEKVLRAQFMAYATVLALGGLLWYRLYRHSRRKAKEAAVEEPVEPEAAPIDLQMENIYRKRQDILHTLGDDMHRLFDSRLEVRNIMSKKISSVPPELTYDEVKAIMADGKLRHLLVVDAKQKLLGVISDRDLYKKTARDAAQMMTRGPFTVNADTLISPAITLLINHRISCLPVLEHDRLVGLLTTTDLLMTLQCTLHTLQKIADDVRHETPPTPNSAPSPGIAFLAEAKSSPELDAAGRA